MLILTHTPLPGSLVVLERIRAAVQAVPWFSLRSGLVVKVSIGVEEYRKPESVEELVQRANAAVLQATTDDLNAVVSTPPDRKEQGRVK